MNEDTPPSNTEPRPSPEPPPKAAFEGHLDDLDHSPYPVAGPPVAAYRDSLLVTYLVDVATYLGAAALGGIIGNRADAGTVAAVRRMFKTVRKRWKKRNTGPNTPLTWEEAIEAARAAVLTQPLPAPSATDLRATRQPDGSWRIVFYEDSHPAVTVTVPAGDPARATILIQADATYGADSNPMRSQDD